MFRWQQEPLECPTRAVIGVNIAAYEAHPLVTVRHQHSWQDTELVWAFRIITLNLQIDHTELLELLLETFLKQLHRTFGTIELNV